MPENNDPVVTDAELQPFLVKSTGSTNVGQKAHIESRNLELLRQYVMHRRRGLSPTQALNRVVEDVSPYLPRSVVEAATATWRREHEESLRPTASPAKAAEANIEEIKDMVVMLYNHYREINDSPIAYTWEELGERLAE